MIKRFFLFFFFLFTTVFVYSQTQVVEQLAAQYYQSGDYEKAVPIYEDLYKHTPTAFYYNYLLSCYLALNQFEKAEKLAKKQSKENPSIPSYQVDIAYVYVTAKDTEKAKKYTYQLIKSIPSVPQQVIDYGKAFQSRQLIDDAIQTFLVGQEKWKDAYSFHMYLADLYLLKKDYSSMIITYIQLLELSNNELELVQEKLQIVFSEQMSKELTILFKAALYEKIQKSPDKTVFSELLYWYHLQVGELDQAYRLSLSLDKRWKEQGQRIYNFASICVENKAYSIAMEAYTYVITTYKHGELYQLSRFQMVYTMYLKIQEEAQPNPTELVALEASFDQLLAENITTLEGITLIQHAAHFKAFYLDKTEQGIALLENALLTSIAPKQKAALKLDLADMYLLIGNQWEATLLYSQVEKEFKNDIIGYEAKFKNAQLFYFFGDFFYAKAQLDILKGATSKLMANDALELSLRIGDNIDVDSSMEALSIFARAELLLFQHKYAQAITTLDSVKLLFFSHSLDDDILYTKAKIAIQQAKFPEAIPFLEQIITQFPSDILADNALFLLAELQEQKLGNREQAKVLYQQLLTDYSGSLYVVEARKRFRQLRGDAL